MPRWWYDFPQSRPRLPAKDGIKAKSRRGRIGESWWAERFITAFEALTDGARLGRGRSYARSGQVMDLHVAPGLATARVQGSRAAPYDVRIVVQPLTEPQWRRVEEAMAAQAIFLAALLAGEMPRDIEDAFAAADLSLFPTRPGELHSECSCPDWAKPCKHIAATAYILGEAFDNDPFLMFALRGRDKPTLLARLRTLRMARAWDGAVAAVPAGGAGDAAAATGATADGAGDASGAPARDTHDGAADEASAATGDGASAGTPSPSLRDRNARRRRLKRTRGAPESPLAAVSALAAGLGKTTSSARAPAPAPRAGAAAPHADEDPPLEARLDDFWNAGPESEQRPPLPQAAQLPDALLRELGPIPAEAGGAHANERLAAAYAVITAAAARRVLGGAG
ncbi:MAG TPA: SWIM zinc finger family protein [Longimicrobiales bacterium]